MREPCDGKLSRTVLRGAWRGDTPSLLSANNYSQFSFDGLWRNTKIVEITSGSVTGTNQFLWCGNDRCEVRDAGGTTVLAQYFSSGQTISGSKYYYDFDDLGSIKEMNNSSGSIVWQQSFDPFGVPTITVSITPADFAYAGMYGHLRSGLNLTKYRQYTPLLGRWLSRDPVEESDTVNLYTYTSNDPINLVDLYGLGLGKCDWTMGCCDIAQNISDLTKDLIKRGRELRKDRRGLPQSGTNSIEGHQQQYAQEVSNLNSCIDLFIAKGCFGPLPGRAMEMAASSPPVPSNSNSGGSSPFLVPIPIPGTPYSWPGVNTPVGPIPIIIPNPFGAGAAAGAATMMQMQTSH